MAGKPYREGDWFAVPLRDGGYARGLLARASKCSVLLGYFFGPVVDDPSHMTEVAGLRPSDAVLIGRFGHLGLLRGTWPIIAGAGDWIPGDWRCSEFVRYEELTGRTFIVHYADDDPGKVVGEVPVSPGTVVDHPQDGMMGAGFVEVRLTRLLRSETA